MPGASLISIHALHTESDDTNFLLSHLLDNISIHALHTESDVHRMWSSFRFFISIHALHTESDSKRLQKICNLLFGMP